MSAPVHDCGEVPGGLPRHVRGRRRVLRRRAEGPEGRGARANTMKTFDSDKVGLWICCYLDWSCSNFHSFPLH